MDYRQYLIDYWDAIDRGNAADYCNGVDPEGFRAEKHIPYLGDYDAEHMLNLYYPSDHVNSEEKLPTVKQLNEEYAELLARKKEAYREYRKAKQEMTDFATAKYDIERFLNLEKEEETRAREKAKTKEETL